MQNPYFQGKKLILSALISFVVAVLFSAHPIFAQQTPTPTVSSAQGANEQQGNHNDFDDDVRKGKDELGKDLQAQERQKEVIDGEDEQAGDGANNDIHEDSNLQEAEHQGGVNEEDKNNNNSEIDEAGDANNLDEQSQGIIDEHQQEQEQQDKTQQEQNQDETPASSSDQQ